MTQSGHLNLCEYPRLLPEVSAILF